MRSIPEQEHIGKKIESLRTELRCFDARSLDCVFDAAFVFVRDVEVADVGAIDRELRGHLDQDLIQLEPGNFARVAVATGEHLKLLPGRADFDAEQNRHDELFLLVEKIVVGDLFADEARIDVLDLACALRIDEERAESVHEVIAGCAGHGPNIGQTFVASKNFFDEDRKARLATAFAELRNPRTARHD